jgi:hypothetical protein
MNIKKPITNAVRTVGGIIGLGEKFVNKAYRNLSNSAYKNAGLPNPAKLPKKQIN